MPKAATRQLTDGIYMSTWIENDLKKWVRLESARRDKSMSEFVRDVLEEARSAQRRNK